jgi:hypothetical protein
MRHDTALALEQTSIPWILDGGFLLSLPKQCLNITGQERLWLLTMLTRPSSQRAPT